MSTTVTSTIMNFISNPFSYDHNSNDHNDDMKSEEHNDDNVTKSNDRENTVDTTNTNNDDDHDDRNLPTSSLQHTVLNLNKTNDSTLSTTTTTTVDAASAVDDDDNQVHDGDDEDDDDHHHHSTKNNNSIDHMDAEAQARYELYLASRTVDEQKFIRCDISSTSIVQTYPSLLERQQYVQQFSTVPENYWIKTIHLSGYELQNVLTMEQIQHFVVKGIGSLPNVTELFIFQGNCSDLSPYLISKCIEQLKHLKVLMLWQFDTLHQCTELAGVIRMHPSLERITINIPAPPPLPIQQSSSSPSFDSYNTKYYQSDDNDDDYDDNDSEVINTTQQHNKVVDLYGCYDMFAMAFAGVPNLKVLQIRCADRRRRCCHSNKKNSVVDEPYKQEVSLISPEALHILFQSRSIERLYLENMGLLDEHIDTLADVISTTPTSSSSLSMLFHIKTIDFKCNLFTDDTLYTFGRILSHSNAKSIESLDISGVSPITPEGGKALMEGIIPSYQHPTTGHDIKKIPNTTLLHIELEGVYENYANEFDVYIGHKYDDWMQRIYYQIRLNRAYAAVLHEQHQQQQSILVGAQRPPPDSTVSIEDESVIHSITNRQQVIEVLCQLSDHGSCLYTVVRNHSHFLFG